MRIKDIIDEDFLNYKIPSMFISTCTCTFKCCTEAGIPISVCQNSEIAQQPEIEISEDEIFLRYRANPITKAVVIGGLEPMLQFDEVMNLIKVFRINGDNSTFVIYTGYYPDEISHQIETLSQYDNIIVKFGRFKPDQKSHRDAELGVDLVNDEQYAIRIS